MKNIICKIKKLSEKICRPLIIMLLCGTHTETVAKSGIRNILPKNIKLLSGPGCPVCVTNQKDIDSVISLALKGIPIACYGDVLKVPGSINTIERSVGKKIKSCVDKNISLDTARELGADVTEVYSIYEAIKLQNKKPNLVFFGIGFETTTPMTALAVKKGMTVYSAHKVFVKAMEALINMQNIKIDGFINPGHVSTIVGIKPYEKLNNNGQKNIPQVIAGFEAEDVLCAVYMILRQIVRGIGKVENEYARLVKKEGNAHALKLIYEVFEIADSYWRGLGKISNSGFEIKKKYSAFDAKLKYKKILDKSKAYSLYSDKLRNNNSGCICGEILKGVKEPRDCSLFLTKCAPENPIGACMVSFEGACGIEAKFFEK